MNISLKKILLKEGTPIAGMPKTADIYTTIRHHRGLTPADRSKLGTNLDRVLGYIQRAQLSTTLYDKKYVDFEDYDGLVIKGFLEKGESIDQFENKVINLIKEFWHKYEFRKNINTKYKGYNVYTKIIDDEWTLIIKNNKLLIKINWNFVKKLQN